MALEELATWLEEARAAGLPEHDAAVLATAGADGRPTAPSLGRQVHAGGRVVPAERELAEALFARRDRPHQLQSMVSRQGEPIDGLAPMRAELEAARRRIGDGPVPCPPDWAALRLVPDFVEYWSAAPDALHDRIVFARDGDGWRRTRLAP
jgi:pyridoxamine 5'-phosphate oxidase